MRSETAWASRCLLTCHWNSKKGAEVGEGSLSNQVDDYAPLTLHGCSNNSPHQTHGVRYTWCVIELASGRHPKEGNTKKASRARP